MSDPIGDKQAYNDLNIRTIFLVGLLSAVGLFVIITGARVLYQKWQAGEYQEKQINVPLASVDAELQEQRAAIDRYGWNPTTDSAAMPIDVAMTELVEELSGEPVADELHSLPTVPDEAGEPRVGTGAVVPDDAAPDEAPAGDAAAEGDGALEGAGVNDETEPTDVGAEA
ncbi:hypothetical protein [Alienimonas sp. DA493]|uniref:hypothetical protein n=1 Tax=Alienimonas sp. DA493 TaxID=3373605 RepID=UPI003754374E